MRWWEEGGFAVDVRDFGGAEEDILVMYFFFGGKGG